MPFGILQYVLCILNGLTSVLPCSLVSHSSLLIVNSDVVMTTLSNGNRLCFS